MTELLDIKNDIDRMRNAATSINQLLGELEALRSHLDLVSKAMEVGKVNGFQMKLTPWGSGTWDAGIVHHVPGGNSSNVNVEAKKKFIAAYRELLLSQVQAVFDRIQDEREKI